MYEINKMPSAIDIGFTGEKLFREIKIDMTKWMEQMPDGVPSIVCIRPGETEADAYIAATTFSDNILTWAITAGDLGEIEGTGVMQVWLEKEENSSVVKRGKSVIVVTRISKAINDADGTTPAAQEAWLEQMTALKVATVNAAGDAETAEAAAEAWATGGSGGTPSATNNSKYYSEQSAGSATSASGSALDSEAYAIGKRNGTDVGSSDPAYHNNSKYYAGEAGTAKTAAEAAKDAAQSAVLHYPYVDPVTGNWMCWDVSTGQWVNTEVHAKGDTGAVPDISVGTVTTLLPSQPATVTRRSGSPDTAPVFEFGIPKGDTGTAENIYGSTIEMSPLDSTKVDAAIGAKADKVTGATSGHFAGLDSNGNLTDSGKQASDFATYETTLRFVPFTIATSDWTLSNGVYKVEYTSAYVTSSCEYVIKWGDDLRNITDDIKDSLKSGGGAIVFETSTVPSGNISGRIFVFDPDDGKIPVLMEDTVLQLSNGGLGANSAAGGRATLGLGDAAVKGVANNLTTNTDGYVLDARQGKALNDHIGNIGIQKHGRGTVAWGSSVDINRPENASMLIFGGRSGYPFMIYIPLNTNEVSVVIGTAISTPNVTSTKVTLTAVSSGYGSTLNYEYFVFT